MIATGFKLLFSLVAAAAIVQTLNLYLERQAMLRALGLSGDYMGWRIAYRRLEKKLSFRRKDIADNFVRAGIYRPELAVWYLPGKLLLAAVLIGGVWLFSDALGLADLQPRLIVTMLVLISVIIVPDFLLQMLQRRRTRLVGSQLPYMIDLMAVCVQTGMTIESAIAYLGEELKSFDKDLAWIMGQTSRRSQVIGLQPALEELMVQFPSSEMRSFVYTLGQSLQHGSSIYEILTSLAANIREIQLLALEEKVGKLAAKMSVPLILLIMFPIVILITAPGIMRLMGNGL